MDLVLKAVSYAAWKHQGQIRKDGRTPYAAHPMRVLLTVVRELGESDPDTLAAAALHDTIEDTTTDLDDLVKEFNETVAGYVALLTKDKRMPEEPREDAYFAGLAAAPRAVKLVKIADSIDNLRDSGQGGNRVKSLAKAERLIRIFSDDPSLAPALELLKRVMFVV